MEEENVQRTNFKQKILNRKTLLIILIVIVVLGVGGTTGVIKATNNPAFCTICHNMQPYYDSWKDSNLLANKHAAAGVTCHQCHESNISIQAEEGFKYITGDYKTPMDTRKFQNEFCLKCHTDFDSIKAKTNFADSNPHDSHNGEMDCFQCHSMHQTSKVFCQQCHFNFKWYKDLPDYWKKQ
jgi:Nitrate/TMAO reductases, membrane-bound tetraheme cytochrome c subunit